jgi:sortase A
MKFLRYLEYSAWASGLLLLGIYGGARWWHANSYADGLAAFGAERQMQASTQPITAPAARRSIDEDIDMSTWSSRRIASYRQAVDDKASPEAVLRIPALELVVPVFEGTSEQNLNRGAGRVEGTSRIGERGNVGIAAHRDGFFRALKDIRVGDELFLDRMTTTEKYQVVKTSIVDPTNVSVLDPTSSPTVTLVTCYPFYYVGAAPQRFIVRAHIVPTVED